MQKKRLYGLLKLLKQQKANMRSSETSRNLAKGVKGRGIIFFKKAVML